MTEKQKQKEKAKQELNEMLTKLFAKPSTKISVSLTKRVAKKVDTYQLESEQQAEFDELMNEIEAAEYEYRDTQEYQNWLEEVSLNQGKE